MRLLLGTLNTLRRCGRIYTSSSLRHAPSCTRGAEALYIGVDAVSARIISVTLHLVNGSEDCFDEAQQRTNLPHSAGIALFTVSAISTPETARDSQLRVTSWRKSFTKFKELCCVDYCDISIEVATSSRPICQETVCLSKWS